MILPNSLFGSRFLSVHVIRLVSCRATSRNVQQFGHQSFRIPTEQLPMLRSIFLGRHLSPWEPREGQSLTLLVKDVQLGTT